MSAKLLLEASVARIHLDKESDKTYSIVHVYYFSEDLKPVPHEAP